MDKEIVVFGDAHYSKNWDTIETCLKGYPLSADSFLNPNRELKHFIDRVNRSSEVGMVVNNGDSVDYHYDDYRTFTQIVRRQADHNRTSNWVHFNAVLKQLDKPYAAVLGNHDYRKEPYNYHLWGTNHVNLPSGERKPIKKKIGHHSFRGPLELSSLAVDLKEFDSPADCSSYEKAKSLIFGKYNCIFLNNGPDAIVRWRNFFRYMSKNLLPPALSFDLDGLNRRDLAYVRLCLSKRSGEHFLIFQHGPLINSNGNGTRNKTYQLTTTDLSTSAARQNIALSTILRGGGGLLKILRQTSNNVTIVCSHTHTAKYFLIHKSSLIAREVSS
ncbi:MAG TPA: metallophosphoesterase, partial [Syntrophales bacterium]|nr:metallophosphoesterase [Syntrophales bacterium]